MTKYLVRINTGDTTVIECDHLEESQNSGINGMDKEGNIITHFSGMMGPIAYPDDYGDEDG